MPLISCPACGRQISVAAEACPQCGHPNRPAARDPAGPKCYACAAPATTRCQSCGALSCVQHLQSIHAGEGYELRCESCYSSAQAWKVFWYVLSGVVLIIFLVAMSQMGRR